jgi:hypothetical protein
LREFSPSAWARVEERTGKEGEENRDSPSTVLSTRPAVTLYNNKIIKCIKSRIRTRI